MVPILQPGPKSSVWGYICLYDNFPWEKPGLSLVLRPFHTGLITVLFGFLEFTSLRFLPPPPFIGGGGRITFCVQKAPWLLFPICIF